MNLERSIDSFDLVRRRNSFNSATWIFEGKMNVKCVMSRMRSIKGMWLGWRARYGAVKIRGSRAVVLIASPFAWSVPNIVVYSSSTWWNLGKVLIQTDMPGNWGVFVTQWLACINIFNLLAEKQASAGRNRHWKIKNDHSVVWFGINL